MPRTSPRLALFLALGSLALGVWLAAPPRAVAQDGGLGQAKMLDVEGAGLFQGGKHRAALERFRAAYAAYPNPTSAWNIARCYEELAELRQAIQAFELFAAERGVSSADKDEARRHIQALQERLKQAQDKTAEAERLEAAGDTAQAEQAWMDAWALHAEPESLLRAGLLQAHRDPMAARLTLEHVLALPALEPELAARARFHIENMGQPRFPDPAPADLARSAPPPDPARAVVPPPREEPFNSSAVVGWSFVGLGVAGLGVGAWFTALYLDDLDAQQVASETPGALDEYRALNAQLDQDETAMGISFGVGGAALLGGLFLLWLDPAEEEQPAQRTSWQLLLTPKQVGLLGTF